MTIEEIIAIADFLGDDITEDQFWRLADEARKLSIADRERLHARLHARLCGGPLYTEISMNRAEMGGYHRY